MTKVQNLKKQAQTAYLRLVDKLSPSSEVTKGALRAFLVGGLICTLGQLFSDIGIQFLSYTKQDASTFSSICLIFLTALLTGIGVFDNIAQFAGAGTIVPITGFANAMVSPALEFKAEGYVLGTGVKLFTIAGPVLVYGISASVIVGIIYYFVNM